MSLVAVDTPPKCKAETGHWWADLGKQDNGEQVHRCGSCLTFKYVKDGVERYEAPKELVRA